MSFVSTNNKSGMGGLTTTTPPITGESGGVTADSVTGSVADAAEAAVEQAAGSLFGALPEPSGLVKAAVAAAQAAAAAGMAQDAVSAIVSAVAGGPGAHNVTVSGSAVPPGALLFASLDGGETLSELFSYVVQLKTPDTLNLGYVSPAANLPLKPMVGKDLCVTKGPQSAIVTGPAGQEIWTDQYGRVKVQFGWDRYGKMDENSSCWIRVSYPWAGKGFGMIQIPRIGQEVLVDFKNGDPDLPIIVGRTYNQDTMPPWGLPGAATQSGIYSHTIGGGPTNANALRFEDKPGSEEVWLHAEKDQRIEVNNNESHWVGNNRVKVIDQSEIATIGAVRDHKVQYDDTSLAGGNKTIQTVKELYLAAGDSITLSCGDTVLYMSSKGEFYVTCKTFNITATDADGQINTIKGQLDLNMNKREPKVGTFGESEKTAMAAVIKETFPPKE
ncbi:type VI secretion system tip protein VgrG [Salmonella enterica subsp. enterica serovar Urbana]|nr:type VI secretion system tip protein VgrG [Salmonella enterica subsp. enterica serovar Urbana]